jgi:hypothetical protein
MVTRVNHHTRVKTRIHAPRMCLALFTSVQGWHPLTGAAMFEQGGSEALARTLAVR